MNVQIKTHNHNFILVSHTTENRVLRRILEPKKRQKTEYDEFPSLYSSPNTVGIINVLRGEY
jgi:hypothetical protein